MLSYFNTTNGNISVQIIPIVNIKQNKYRLRQQLASGDRSHILSYDLLQRDKQETPRYIDFIKLSQNIANNSFVQNRMTTLSPMQVCTQQN